MAKSGKGSAAKGKKKNATTKKNKAAPIQASTDGSSSDSLSKSLRADQLATSTRTETAEGSHVVTVATDNEATAANPIPDAVNQRKAQELAGELWSLEFLQVFNKAKAQDGGDTIPRAKFEEILTGFKNIPKAEAGWTADIEKWQATLTDLPKALLHAKGMGKTPLIVDTTDNKAVDSFFGYQSCVILEAKKVSYG